MGYTHAGIRWNSEIVGPNGEDGWWELRCPDCAAARKGAIYWPLTDEHWDRHIMTRCLACHAIRRRKWERQAYWTTDRRAKAIAYMQRYRKESAGAKRLYQADYYAAHREREKAKAKARYYANREAILERKRAAYAAVKDAA